MPYFPGLSPITLDKPNGWVGVGITPATILHAFSEAANTEFRFQNSVDSGSPLFSFYRSRGNAAAPTAIVNGARIGEIQFRGYGATDFFAGGFIRMIANATWTDTSAPTDFQVLLSASGSVAPSAALTVKSTGRVGTGSISSPTAWLHAPASTSAAASLCLPHGAAPGSPVNGDMWTTTAGAFIRINGVTYSIDLTAA